MSIKTNRKEMFTLVFNIPVSRAFSMLLSLFVNSLSAPQVVVSSPSLYSIDPLSFLAVLLFSHTAFQL